MFFNFSNASRRSIELLKTIINSEINFLVIAVRFIAFTQCKDRGLRTFQDTRTFANRMKCFIRSVAKRKLTLISVVKSLRRWQEIFKELVDLT